MPPSLQEELKQFEKELSLLLVRFMKICDQVETLKAAPAPPPPAPQSLPLPSQSEGGFIAYA